MTFRALEVSLEGPGSIFNRFWLSFGGPLGHHFLKKSALGTVSVRPMFSVSFLDAFLMGIGCSREPPDEENSSKFIQLSSKIKVRRNCDQGGSGMQPGSIF